MSPRPLAFAAAGGALAAALWAALDPSRGALAVLLAGAALLVAGAAWHAGGPASVNDLTLVATL